jgi:hypothetical protein
MQSKKIKALQKQKQEAIEKLEGLYKNFRGVKHEDSASEIKYVQIKVLEDFINSIDAEIKSLDNSSK